MTPRTDDLTRLPLRSAFLEAAGAAIERARRAGTPVSLLVIDVDYFKQVNDTYGHLQGDDVLVGVADVLRRTLRAADLPARYAGDEFLALLPDTAPAGARDVADRVCAAVRGHVFALRDRPGAVPITVSVGVASFPGDGDSTDLLFAAADRALYQAKRAGRDGAVSASSGAASPVATPTLDRFVGRSAELRDLGRYLEDAAAGDPRLVVVAGEAGVGKTTLVQQIEPELRLRAGLLARGRCLEADVRPPLAPLADVIGTIERRQPLTPPQRWQQLPRLVPALAAPAAAPSGGNGADHPAGDGADRYVLLEEIARYLRLASGARPLAVVLDDVQWASAELWDALEYLVNALERERLLLVITLRGEELRGEALARRQRLSRHDAYREVVVGRLTREEVGRWVDAAFHRQDLGRDFLAYLYRRTEGNPLFVAQLLRRLVGEQGVRFNGERWEWEPGAEAAVPTPLVDLAERRLARLPFESRRTLAAAAILGREFDVELAVDAGAATEAELLAAVEDGVRAEVLAPPAPGGGDRYRFTHALLSELLVEGMMPRRRRAAHGRAAQALLRRAPGAAAEIARHFDEAEDAPNAFRYALQAAAQARVVYAHDEAERFLSAAERHATTPGELAEARGRRAEVAEETGRYAAADALFALALAWYGAQGDRVRALPLRRRRERVRALLGRPPRETLAAAWRLLAEAQQLGMERERVALLDLLSQTHARLGEHAEAERDAWAAVHAAGSLGAPTLRADALDRLAVTVGRLYPEQAVSIHRQALAIYETTGDTRGQAAALAHLGTAHVRRGRWREGQEAIEQAVAVAGPVAPPDFRGYLALALGAVHLRRGEYPRARELFAEAMRLFAAVGNGDLQLDALLHLAHLERERGDAPGAAELYDAAVAFARRLGRVEEEVVALGGGGLARLADGGVEAAASASAAADALAARRDGWFEGRELADALAVRLLVLRGEPAEAWSRFEAAAAAAEVVDAYSAAWLTAECADALLPHEPAGVRRSVTRYVGRMGDLGAGPVRRRYDELLAAS